MSKSSITAKRSENCKKVLRLGRGESYWLKDANGERRNIDFD